MQRMNWVLMPIPAIVLLLELTHIPPHTTALSIAIYVFALLEYVNYFHVQLSYDNASDIRYLQQHKRLKVASLKRDFKRLKE